MGRSVGIQETITEEMMWVWDDPKRAWVRFGPHLVMMWKGAHSIRGGLVDQVESLGVTPKTRDPGLFLTLFSLAILHRGTDLL